MRVSTFWKDAERLTFCVGMTRENFLSQSCNSFSVFVNIYIYLYLLIFINIYIYLYLPIFINIYIFLYLLIFKYNPGKTNNKFITSQSFLSTDISHQRVQKECDELLVYGLVTRYGPQSVASSSGFFFFLVPNCDILSVSSVFKCNPGRTSNKFITSQ